MCERGGQHQTSNSPPSFLGGLRDSAWNSNLQDICLYGRLCRPRAAGIMLCVEWRGALAADGAVHCAVRGMARTGQSRSALTIRDVLLVHQAHGRALPAPTLVPDPWKSARKGTVLATKAVETRGKGSVLPPSPPELSHHHLSEEQPSDPGTFSTANGTDQQKEPRTQTRKRIHV